MSRILSNFFLHGGSTRISQGPVHATRSTRNFAIMMWCVKIIFQWNISRNQTGKKSLTRVITWIIYNWQFCVLFAVVEFSSTFNVVFHHFSSSSSLISLLLPFIVAHKMNFIWYLWETEAFWRLEMKQKCGRRRRRSDKRRSRVRQSSKASRGSWIWCWSGLSHCRSFGGWK